MSVLRVRPLLFVRSCFQHLQATLLPAGLLLPLLPLRQRGLCLPPACARPRRIDELHPKKQLPAPSGLPQHLLGVQHKTCIIGQRHLGHGGWRSCAWGRPIAVRSQEPMGLVLVLLRNHLPALIA